MAVAINRRLGISIIDFTREQTILLHALMTLRK